MIFITIVIVLGMLFALANRSGMRLHTASRLPLLATYIVAKMYNIVATI